MTTPNWIPVATLIIAAANFGWLVWRHYRRPKPPLICRVERVGEGLFLLFVHPVPGHEAVLVDVIGNGVVLAQPVNDPGYDPGPPRAGVFSRVMPMGVPLKIGQERPLHFHFFASQPFTARSRFRFQKSCSITARARLTSPINVQIESKIPISVT